MMIYLLGNVVNYKKSGHFPLCLSRFVIVCLQRGLKKMAFAERTLMMSRFGVWTLFETSQHITQHISCCGTLTPAPTLHFSCRLRHLKSIKNSSTFQKFILHLKMVCLRMENAWGWRLKGSFFQTLAIDLLNPSNEAEQRRHKLKRLVPRPNSFFMDVRCSSKSCSQWYNYRVCI